MRIWMLSLAVAAVLVTAGPTLGQGMLDFDDLVAMPTKPDPQSLPEMLARLDAKAAELEDSVDVKCWTSLGQLETFVAGAEFTPQATHAKSEALVGYLDQVWRAAERAAAVSGPVTGEAFDAASARFFPIQREGFTEVRVSLGERIVVIPHQDVRDYGATVEPLRLLRTTAQRVADTEPDRAPLSSLAIQSATELATVLATVVLKEANAEARGRRHERVEADDVIAADQRIASAVGLSAHDPGKAAGVVHAAPDTGGREAMLEVIQGKVDSLSTFNRRYSSEKLGTEFDEDLTGDERGWARLPVSEEASRFYKEEILVDLAKRLYRECAREHPGSDPLTGPQMLETLSKRFPVVAEFFGTTNLFQSLDEPSFWVPEYLADTFRDSGWHWRSLQRAVLDLEGEKLPSMDLYAMEELSELLSIYAIALIQTAGHEAREAGAKTVAVSHLKAAIGAFEASRKQAQEVARRTEPERESWEAAASRAREGLAQSFVAEAFTPVTAESGLDFVYEESQLISRFRFPPEGTVVSGDGTLRIAGGARPLRSGGPEGPITEIGIAGGGVAVADVDGDGRLDAYLVNGRRDRLYRNLGGLRFEDVTDAAGLDNTDQGRAAYFVDYDNDGDADLFLTQVYAPNRLFRNRGDGTFEDVTARAGLPLEKDRVSHSATWFDFDNDGHLDVYVGNFGNWPAHEFPRIHHSRNGQANRLFRADGKGGFEDITERARAGSTGWTHAVSHFDANGDGWQDLYLANDFGRDELLINVKGERFFDATPQELRERSLHGMSVGFTDGNRDGIDDVYVSNIAISEYGDGWAWDADFFDFDNDGLADLYIANGREPNVSYDRERNVLYRQSEGRFFDVSRGSGADIPANSRGVAAADFDDDGDLDLLVNNYRAEATLLRNNLRRNHWVKIRLEGTGSNRDAIGVRVVLQAEGGEPQQRTVRGGSGFLSNDPLLLTFGLGAATRIERLEVHWPSGITQTLVDLDGDRLHHVKEPSPSEADSVASGQ
jgi:hypothetical protein